MMIKFKDFSPQVSKTGLLGHVKESDSFESIVKQANIWINSNPIEVINIETVVLPNTHFQPKKVEPEIGVIGVAQTYNLFQCVRVWYREK